MGKPARASKAAPAVPGKPQHRDLAAYIEATGDTQAHIAHAMHVSQAQISRIVTGQSLPRAALAVRLANYAHIPVGSFARCYLLRASARLSGEVA